MEGFLSPELKEGYLALLHRKFEQLGLGVVAGRSPQLQEEGAFGQTGDVEAVVFGRRAAEQRLAQGIENTGGGLI